MLQKPTGSDSNNDALTAKVIHVHANLKGMCQYMRAKDSIRPSVIKFPFSAVINLALSYCHIPYKFHVGIVDSATKSLFVYQPEHNWDSFYDPYFVPSFEPNFSDPTLESKANEICGDDSSCLFDIAATGNIDVGISTLESSKIIDEIYTFLLPGLNN